MPRRLILPFLMFAATPAMAQDNLAAPRPAPAATAESRVPDLAAFDQAVADDRVEEATKLLDAIMARRQPSDGRPRIDPLVANALAHLYVARSAWGQAFVLLNSVDLTALEPSQRLLSTLAFARSLEGLGEREKALAAYRSTADLAVRGSNERRAAVLGIARLTMITDAVAARTILTEFRNDPEQGWEPMLLDAEAASLAGDRATATQLASRAWLAAADAPAEAMAPLKVALLKAGLAASRNDGRGQMAMLMAANAQAARPADEITSRLPTCGENGLKPSDWVTVGAAAGPNDRTILMPLAVSRPAVLPQFFDLLSGTDLLSLVGYPSPRGTLLTLACVSAVAENYYPKEIAVDPMSSFLAEHGLYYALLPGLQGNDAVNELGRRIEAIEQGHGANNLLLLPLRLQMLELLQARLFAGETVNGDRLSDLARNIAVGLRAAGAPADFARTYDARVDYDRVQREAAQGQWDLAKTEQVTQKLLMAMPFQFARAWVVEMFKKAPPEAAAFKARLITALATRAPGTMKPRDRRAWLRFVANTQRAGDMNSEARATLSQAGLNPDLCFVADEEPKLLERSFVDRDFPRDPLRTALSGRTVLELSLSSSGAVAQARIVLSAPSGAFDSVTREKAQTLRYLAARRGGKARSCTGLIQSVRWALPKIDQFDAPTLVPTPSDETS